MAHTVRDADDTDAGGIQGMLLRTFPESENEIVARLALDLLGGVDDDGNIALVVNAGKEVVGFVAFSPMRLDKRSQWKGYVLAPLGVDPRVQGGGIGTALVQAGMTRLRERRADMVFVYGDPAYYGRFGFDADTARGFVPAHPLQYPSGWQGLVLAGSGPAGPGGTLRSVAALDDPSLW